MKFSSNKVVTKKEPKEVVRPQIHLPNLSRIPKKKMTDESKNRTASTSVSELIETAKRDINNLLK